jgi:hypothetical protein
MNHVLAESGYLLVGAAPLPFMVDLAVVEPMWDFCEGVRGMDIALRSDRLRPAGQAGLLFMRWNRGELRHVVIFFIDLSAVIMGGDVVRGVQRVWRKHRQRGLEERRLALCMGAHARLGTVFWLDRMLCALCESDLRTLF